MYAMVEIKGNQYKAEKGELLTVDVVASEKGDVVEFDSVLLLRDDKNLKIGEPYIAGARVKAVVEDHVRGDKVIVHKYKRRKRYKRTRGHRQHYTVLRVEEISG
ncbi:MAG TPA: 50S ribosomal protein L21 [Spirochaetia bacterium]|nr:50S ribosomal protein L21 [Spirochaetia bacterium]